MDIYYNIVVSIYYLIRDEESCGNIVFGNNFMIWETFSLQVCTIIQYVFVYNPFFRLKSAYNTIDPKWYEDNLKTCHML